MKKKLKASKTSLSECSSRAYSYSMSINKLNSRVHSDYISM